MVTSAYFLCLQFLSLIALCLSSIQDVALNFNTASKEYEMKMSQGKNTFLELISKGIFVDKTLLIDAFISHPEENLVIPRPVGWGKTINLDMLRMFFEMPLYPNGTKILPISSTPNYRLFKEGKYYSNGYNITLKSPLLISQPEYWNHVEEHLGQYPVIHWSFDEIAFSNDTDGNGIITEINKKVYDQHRYLPTEDYWRYSRNDIRILIIRLNDYFKKKAVVLVDGYDRFSNGGNDIWEIVSLLQRCTKYHDDIYENKQKTLLTCTEERNLFCVKTPYRSVCISSLFKNLYGLTNMEMNLIYNHYSITKHEQNLIQYWYAGYLRPDENNQASIFHPSAICSYLNTRQFESFSLHAKFNSYMKKLMGLETSLYEFTRSINGGGRFCLCLNKRPLSWDTPWEFKSLLFEGYFTNGDGCPYEIPNFQTANHLQNTLGPYCTALFDHSWSTLLAETYSIWDWFLLSDVVTSKKLQSNMNKCYKIMSRYYEDIIKKDRDLPISNSVKVQLSAVTSVMPSKKLHFVGWHYKSFPKNRSDRLPKTNILLSSGGRGIFINIREDEGEINAVVNQSSKYMQTLERYAKFHRWNDIKFVDCKVLPYDKLEIYATIRQLNRR